MSPRTKTGLALAGLAVAVLLVALRTASVLSDPLADEPSQYGLRDFRSTMYYPPVALADGVNPYDSPAYRAAYPVLHFPLYSPVTLVLYQPFRLLSLDAAHVAYFALCVALSLSLAWLAFRTSGVEALAHRVIALAAGIVICRPGQQSMMNGQSTLLVVTGLLLALQYARSRPWVAALGVVLGTLKPAFGLPLLLVLAARRDFKALGRGLLLVGGLSLLVLGYIATFEGSGGIAGVFDALRANLGRHGQHPNTNLATTYSRVDGVLLVSRASDWIPGIGAQFAIAFAGLALALAALARSDRRTEGAGAASLSGVLGCLAILLFLYHQSYDLLVLVVPAVAVASARQGPWNTLGPLPRGLLLVCLIAPLFNFAATASGLRVLGLDEPPRSDAAWRALTLLNPLAVATAFALCLGLAWRSPRRPAA